MCLAYKLVKVNGRRCMSQGLQVVICEIDKKICAKRKWKQKASLRGLNVKLRAL